MRPPPFVVCQKRTERVPVLSAFFGIIIRMFYNEHEPPHFHAEHQGQHGKFDMMGEMIVGGIQSRTALRLIREWAQLHERELQRNWELVKSSRPLEHIEPLQ